MSSKFDTGPSGNPFPSRVLQYTDRQKTGVCTAVRRDPKFAGMGASARARPSAQQERTLELTR